jgi:hypothetical protein
MNCVARLISAALIFAACAVVCAAQVPSRADTHQSPPAPVPTSALTQGSSDEDFDLNIPERRITRENFFASTELAAGDESARGLSLRVGVEVGAERIDVLLRNVQGHVRFRGSLDALRRVLDARRATAAAELPRVAP